MCLGIALERRADIIVELHPDAEYLPDGIVPAMREVKMGAKLVLGNRFLIRVGPFQYYKTQGPTLFKQYPRGMRWWKFVNIKILNNIHNYILKTHIPDLHQGFRVYTKKLLNRIDYRSFANDYLFSFQIILAALRLKLPIVSVPVTTHYRGKKRGATFPNSLKYGLQTIFLSTAYRLFPKDWIPHSVLDDKVVYCKFCNNSFLVSLRFRIGKFSLLHCTACENGFVTPIPPSMKPFYPHTYWRENGLGGFLKNVAFSLFQRRRVHWTLQYLKEGKILDVGSGEGLFAHQLTSNIKPALPAGRHTTYNKYQVTSLEAPFAHIENNNVIRTDFLNYIPRRKFDAITFWESLEHIPDPIACINKAFQLLKPGGYLFIEYPRNDVLEVKLFGKKWFHLDVPRHLLHFSSMGLVNLVKQSGFWVIESKPVWAPEYAPWGLAASIMEIQSGQRITTARKIILLALLPFCTVSELILYSLGQSPIGLVVARKAH